MTIKVYASNMSGDPVETHDVHGVTIGHWLGGKGVDYRSWYPWAVSVAHNGVLIEPGVWPDTMIREGDVVDICYQPNGGVFKAIGSILGSILKIFGFGGGRGNDVRNSPAQGRKLETSDAKANTAKLGEVVPELAGRHRRFPDYLTPPRRYFVNKREQWLEFLCCVGPGQYEIPDETVKVGDTPFSGLGADGSYAVYPPNTNLSGVQAHEHWHTVDEVGGTSSGTAGLELGVDPARKEHIEAPEYVFSGVTISIPEGTGTFPPGWGQGTIVSILLSRSLVYAVTGGDMLTPNVFTGDFAHLRPVSNGSPVFVVGVGLAGLYLAQAVSLDSQGSGGLQLWTIPIPPTESSPGVPSAPISGLTPGSYTLTTNAGARNYTLTAASEGFITLSAASFPAITAPATIQFSGGTVYGEWTSRFAACPVAERTTTFELDFFFPGGLGYVNDDGDVQAWPVYLEVQYRDVSGGAYTSVPLSYREATLDQIGFTERFSVPLMTPEVRVRRVGSPSTSTQVQDKIQFYSLRSRLPTRTQYPNWTTMSVKIRSGGRMAAASENQVNLIATRILPVLENGSWSAPRPTRDITALVKYIASTIGYTDDDLDMGELQRLGALWVSRGDTFDYVFDETTVREALRTALRAGMAEFTVSDGQIKPVREGIRTAFEQGYSPQNMTGPLRRSFTSRKDNDADGVEVEFINEATWTKEVVRCFLPGDQGFKIEKMKLDGVTNRARAWRIGMRRRRSLRYHQWEYSFGTEMDALNSEYLSYVPLVDDIPGYGQSAIMVDIKPTGDQTVVVVSEPTVWIEGRNHVVAYRRPDGSVAGPWPATPGHTEFEIIAPIPQPWPIISLRLEPPHVYFGTAEAWSFPALITDIKPSGTDRVSVTAKNYNARVYADDDNQPPAA